MPRKRRLAVRASPVAMGHKRPSKTLLSMRSRYLPLMGRGLNIRNTTCTEQKRTPGRPRSVSADDLATAVAVRLPRDVLAAVTQWAVDNETTRSDAIRRLLEKALGKAK